MPDPNPMAGDLPTNPGVASETTQDADPPSPPSCLHGRVDPVPAMRRGPDGLWRPGAIRVCSLCGTWMDADADHAVLS